MRFCLDDHFPPRAFPDGLGNTEAQETPHFLKSRQSKPPADMIVSCLFQTGKDFSRSQHLFCWGYSRLYFPASFGSFLTDALEQIIMVTG